jgi:hypothetical protein
VQYFSALTVIVVVALLPACRNRLCTLPVFADAHPIVQQTIDCTTPVHPDVSDIILKMVDIPLPLQIVSLDSMSEISEDGNGIYVAFHVADDYFQVVLFYAHEMERYGWRSTTTFASPHSLHSMIVFEKPNGDTAVITVLGDKSTTQWVTVKIYRTTSEMQH